MLMDWNNPPQLSVRKRHARNVEELGRLKARRVKRKGSKAHATNKERAHVAALKSAKLAHDKAVRAERRKAFLAAVRAYWRGDGDHP